MKEDDETVFEYFQRNQIDFLESFKDVLYMRIEMLEKICIHRMGSEYIALLEKQIALMDDYRLFLDEFNGAEMYLKEINEAISQIRPPTHK